MYRMPSVVVDAEARRGWQVRHPTMPGPAPAHSPILEMNGFVFLREDVFRTYRDKRKAVRETFVSFCLYVRSSGRVGLKL